MNVDTTPIIVGVGEAVQHLSSDLTKAVSAQQLAGQAAAAALDDALSVDALASHIDVLVATRTFPDTTSSWPSPFGRTNNMPRSIAKRIGANPRQAIYSVAGGQSPQRNVNSWCERLASGDASMVLLAGAEVIASTKAALKAQVKLDWAEEVEGDIEDEGSGVEDLLSIDMLKHGLAAAPAAYALCEIARRARGRTGQEEYAQQMAAILEPFAAVAKANPYSMFNQTFTAKTIMDPSGANGYIAYPYTKAMVAKDAVNQAAAVLLTTVGKARELGLSEEKWVFLHAYADANDKSLLKRPDLGHSPALSAAIQHALAEAGIRGEDLEFIDAYSCFPIVVLEAMQALGLEPGEKRLTETGGLPFFGGPGNNYSMHGIASVIHGVRRNKSAYGLVSANGGVMNKHSVGVYSCRPGWRRCDSTGIQRMLDSVASVELEEAPEGNGTIETYTVTFQRGVPTSAVIVGRMASTGKRFVANGCAGDSALIQRLLTEDMAGEAIVVAAFDEGNRASLNLVDLDALRTASEASKLR